MSQTRVASRKRRGRVLKLHPVPSSRLITVVVLLCSALGGLGMRLAWLQLVAGEQLESRARQAQTERRNPLGRRRTIVDRQGRLLAIDEERVTVWAHPRYFRWPGDDPEQRRSPREVAEKLAPILGVSASSLSQRMGQHRSGVRLASNLEPSTAARLKTLNIDGIDFEHGPQRIYPQGDLFANVLGFLNLERSPQAGLELSLDDKLRSQELKLGIRRSGDGTPLPDGIGAGSMHRDDLRLQLTLDTRLQRVAQLELLRQVEKWNAKRGAALVMDARNGELLALASVPTYDPNRFWKFKPGLFREWAVQDLYEPGSTFKPINLALALQEGAIKANGQVYDNGTIKVGGWPINNHDRKVNGMIDFATVLQVSSNVGMVQAMRRLPADSYWDWLSRLRLDARPDTDLPGAIAGQLKSKEQFTKQPIEPATASFGQGFSLTPLKLVQLHALLANGGRLVSPHITRGLRAGNALASAGTRQGQQLLKPEVTRTVLAWMESVVEKGSGKGVRTPGYRIGGKTGTAQKALNGVYVPGALICSFVATLPIEDPRYVVLVVVDEPQGGNAYGSTVALPVAKSIIDGLLVIEKIPPSIAQSPG